MRLEPARPADLPALADLVNAAYRGESARAGWTHEADLLGGQRTDVALLQREMAAGALMLLARQRASLSACVALTPRPRARFDLGMLAVRPTLQARGLGRRVLEAAEAFARASGGREVSITVLSARESLILWYERRGYRATGERKPFPIGEPRIGLPKTSDLEFIVMTKAL